MKAVRQAGTDIELALRSALHRAGLRFRVNRQIVPLCRSRADVVFMAARVAVFVDGCFWHGCPRHGTMPKQNTGWWQEKIAANQARDRRVNDVLAAAGWRVVRIWEHDSLPDALRKITRALGRRRECALPDFGRARAGRSANSLASGPARRKRPAAKAVSEGAA